MLFNDLSPFNALATFDSYVIYVAPSGGGGGGTGIIVSGPPGLIYC